MKNGLIFFMGFLVGVILTAVAAVGLGIAYYSDYAADSETEEEDDTGITYAEEWTEFTVARKFKVIEVLEDGVLAKCEDPDPFRSISDIERPSTFHGPEVYILTSGKNLFYNDQIVEVPAGQKAMQIGTWRFRQYDHGSEKVVPIIVFK